MAKTPAERVMNDTREAVLNGVRRALGRKTLSAEQRAELDAHMQSPPRGIRPKLGGDLRRRFVDQLSAVAGTNQSVQNLDSVPGAVLAYMQEHDLGHNLVAAPALQGLPWPEALQMRFGASEGEDLVSVTPCLAAIAETGTLVLLSGPASPTTLNFLPDDHIVVVKAEQLVAHAEDVWPQLRELPDGLPRTVNLISGPSKTADVEQTLQLGAHGPRRLHVIFVET